jgi:hypothetical protein
MYRRSRVKCLCWRSDKLFRRTLGLGHLVVPGAELVAGTWYRHPISGSLPHLVVSRFSSPHEPARVRGAYHLARGTAFCLFACVRTTFPHLEQQSGDTGLALRSIFDLGCFPILSSGSCRDDHDSVGTAIWGTLHTATVLLCQRTSQRL